MFMYIVGPAAVLYIIWEMRRFSKVEKQKLIAAFVFIIFSIFFWAFYEQSGGSLSLFARDNLHDNVLGLHMNPNVINNSANSLFIILFSPLVGLAWVGLARKNAEPNTVIKFGLGFLFLAVAFYLFYACRFSMDASGKSSLNMFTFAYFVITFGELCLSPIGLSLMTKLSPKPLWGMMMGMWFLASAYGQYAAGILGKGMSEASGSASLAEKLMAYTDGYKHLALYALVAGGVLIAISPFVRKLMHEVK
jgi:POT family proton-dependent oligopeptide transporter